MSVALFSLSLGLTLGQELGFTSPPILTAFAVSLVAGAAFVRFELKSDHPMIQLRLFRNPTLSISVVSGFLAFLCLSATFFLMPFYLEGVLGLEIGTVGLLLGAGPLMVGILSPISGTLSDRLGIRTLTLSGLLIMAIVYVGFQTLDTDTSIPHYLLLAIPLGAGIALFQSPNNSAIMGAVPREYMGIGGGILTLTRLLGQISGIAVMGSIWAASVSAALGGTLPEGGASSADAATQVAGLHLTFMIAAVVMFVAVGIGAWGLKRERQDSAVIATG